MRNTTAVDENKDDNNKISKDDGQVTKEKSSKKDENA
jgi:hypothetical protein